MVEMINPTMKRTPTPKPSTATLHNISAMPITLIFLLITASISNVAAFSFGRYAPDKPVVATTNRFLAANHHQSRRQNYRHDRQQQLFQSSYDSETTNNNNDHYDEYNDRQRHEYTLEANSDPTINESCSFTEDQIHLLIAKRLECKKRRKFDDADKILDALNKYGIYLQDKQRKYRVDGQNHFGRRKRYVQRGGSYGLVSEHQDEGGNNDLIAVVEELVEERARYKRMREYHKSDEITIVLKEKYGVKVNDRRREWMVEQKGAAAVHDDGKENNGGDGDHEHQNSITPESYYIPTLLAPKDHPTHTMSDETKQIIQNRLKDRSMARETKDYKAADRIRDELMDEYSILIDDRTKEWKVALDSSTTDEDSFFDDRIDDDPFAREAQLSQRSAFVQKSWEIPFDNHTDINHTTNNADMDSQNERNVNANANREESSLDAELSRIIVAKKTDGDEVAALLSPPLPSPGDEAAATTATTMDEMPTRIGESGTEGTPIEATTRESVDELNALTVVALKEKLRNAGLPVSGKKSELIDRLLPTPSNGSTQ